MKRFLGAAFAAIMLVAPAWASVGVTLDHGTIWQTKKIGADTQAFLQIHNTGDTPETLTAWSCPLADTTALLDAAGKPLQSLSIPAGKTITLAGGGPHLLLHNAHFTVDYGSAVPCAFTFTEAGAISGYLYAVAAPE